MSEKSLRKDILYFNLLLLFLLAVVAVLLACFSEVNILLMFALFSGLSFTVILSYSLGLQKGLIAAVVFTFLYGSYVIYNVLVTQKITQAALPYVIWLFLFPVGALLAGRLSAVVSQYEWELKSIQGLKGLVTIDGSTGFYNNQGFFKKLDEEFWRARRYKNPFSLLLVKVVNFNEIRIVYGDVDAAKILKAVADIMNAKVRFSDIRGVLDEDILSVILTETDEAGGKVVVEKLHEVLNMVTVDIKGSRRAIRIKPSIGVASIREQDTDVLEVYERAQDELHYDRG